MLYKYIKRDRKLYTLINRICIKHYEKKKKNIKAIVF